jgi:hypothetical protein
MKTSLLSSVAPAVRNRFRIAALSILILAIVVNMALSANAVGIPFGIKGLGKPSVHLTCDPVTKACFIDPENVEAFSLSIEFDSSVLTFDSIIYIAPYVETTPPDLSQVADGYIYNIAGSIAAGDVAPAGDVNIFEVIYTASVAGTEPLGYDTVFASTGDYVDAIDPDTGAITYFGPSQIVGVACTQESSTALLTVAGALAMAMAMRKRMANGIR